MDHKLRKVLTLGTASALFLIGLAGPALAKHPHSQEWAQSDKDSKYQGWKGSNYEGARPVAGPEMNLGTAGNALLLLGGALLLLVDNYRNT